MILLEQNSSSLECCLADALNVTILRILLGTSQVTSDKYAD